jgi:acetyltransferase-like isoleucine patch superfamily enzyme
MTSNSRLSKPRLGPHAVLDVGVQLNALPGRKLSGPRPLVIGAQARVRSGTVLYAATQIGHHFETGHHVVVREENKIGNQVSVWNNTTIDYGCRIGNRVKIHCNCYIAQYSVLEDDVFLAPGVTLANDLFPGSKHAGRVLQGPVIGKGAQVGVNATLLPGVKIGARAVIGAGSVVTHDIPEGAVVWGNPARVHKNRDDLQWPVNFYLSRLDAQAFYRKRLAGRPVFD